MKKLFTALFILAILPLSLLSQNELINNQRQAKQMPLVAIQANTVIDKSTTGKGQDMLQLNYSRVFNNMSYGQSGFYSFTTPFVYEPISKTLFVADAQFIRGTQPLAVLNLATSTDLGANWSTKQIDRKSNALGQAATLSIINPNNTTDPNKLYLFATYQVFDGATPYPYLGNQYLVINGNGPADTLFDLYKNPTDPPDPGQNFTWTKSASSNKTKYCYHAGQLNPISDQYQYGNYGILSFFLDPNAPDIKLSEPSKWSSSIFRDAGSKTSSYNTNIDIDVDEQGTVYAIVNNILKSDINNRLPMVSKSSDNGATWSDFDPMPPTVLSNYITSNQQGNPQYSGEGWPYMPYAFVVTGVDEFSYFLRLGIGKDANTPTKWQIAEVYKKSGIWQIRKVSDIFYTAPMLITDHNPVSGSTVTLDSLEQGIMYYEFQAAKTADGKSILVKWLDYVDQVYVLPTQFPVAYDRSLGQNGMPPGSTDSVLTDDVFVSYRDLSNNTWSTAKNVTNDNTFNKGSIIPHIIPDLQHVPMLTLQSVQSTTAPRNMYDPFMTQMCIDNLQTVMFSLFDATGAGNVAEDNSKLSFTLNDVYPNPAGEIADIGFVLDTPGYATLELFNSMGQRVQTLHNGQLSSGIYAVNVHTNNLTDGVYYYKLTVGNQSITKILTVVK